MALSRPSNFHQCRVICGMCTAARVCMRLPKCSTRALRYELPMHASAHGLEPIPCLLQGDLALLAREGSRGIPVGHIVSHNAHHGLHLKFLQALRAAAAASDYVAVEAPGDGAATAAAAAAAASAAAEEDSDRAAQE